MSLSLFGPALALLCLAFASGLQQDTSTTPTRDPQAVAILAQALDAAGGSAAVSTIQDFTANGRITLSSAPNDVSGRVSIKSRGLQQFRLEVTLPEGVSTTVANSGTVWTRGANGNVHPLFNQHTDFAGSAYFPFEEIASWLADPKVSLTDLGIVTEEGTQLHAIRARKNFLRQVDPMGTRAKLSETEILIDPTNSLVVKTRDMVTTRSGYDPRVPHELIFSDYRKIDGVLFAFSVVETIYHQRTLAIQFDQVAFNTGLTDSDFEN